jgi:hypothetical protein
MAQQQYTPKKWNVSETTILIIFRNTMKELVPLKEYITETEEDQTENGESMETS